MMMFCHPFSIARRTPSCIAIASIVSMSSLICLRFISPTIVPFLSHATTLMPTLWVSLHHEASQFNLIVIPVGGCYCRFGSSSCGRVVWFGLCAPLCSSYAFLVFILTLLGLGCFASKVALHLAFQICQHVRSVWAHLLSLVVLPPRVFARLRVSHSTMSIAFGLSIVQPIMAIHTYSVHPHSRIMCSRVSAPPHIGQLELTFIPLRAMFALTAIAFVSTVWTVAAAVEERIGMLSIASGA